MHGWRKEGKNESVKEEGSDPRSERKGAEKSNIDPKICWTRVPESIKIDPKGSQNEDKTDKKWKQPRQDDLGPPWVAIFQLSGRSYGAFLDLKIQPNS